LRRNSLPKHVIEGKVEGNTEVMGRQERRSTQLLDDFKGDRGYCNLKEEALVRTLWRIRFDRGYGMEE